MMEMTEEKIKEWARRIVFFDWSGDRSDSYSVYLKCVNGKRKMIEDAQKDQFTEQDIANIKYAVEDLIQTNWQSNVELVTNHFKERVNYVFNSAR